MVQEEGGERGEMHLKGRVVVKNIAIGILHRQVLLLLGKYPRGSEEPSVGWRTRYTDDQRASNPVFSHGSRAGADAQSSHAQSCVSALVG